MKQKYIVLFLLILISLTVFSQPVQQEWVASYNGPDNLGYTILAMAMDSSGNIIVTGYTNRTNGRQDYCTVKYNSSGTRLWVAIYDGIPSSNGVNWAYGICVDVQGNIYVTGYSERASFGSDDYCTIKYNSQGVQQWVSRYNYQGSGASDAFSITINGNGIICITGESTSNTGYDFATVCYNNNGDSLWVERYDDPLHWDDFGEAVAFDDTGNVYVGGGGQYGGMIIIKYNSSGVQQWIATNVSTGGIVKKLKLDSQGFIYVCGPGPNGYMTRKYNSNGIQQWMQAWGNQGDVAFDFVLDSFQNVYVTGRIWGGTSNDYNYGTIKYNISGLQQWQQTYNGPSSNNDEAYSISIDDAASIYITGRSVGSTGYEICTIKYSVTGSQQWLIRYTSDGNAGGSLILIDRNKNVYVAGGLGLYIGSGIIKYSQLVPVAINQNKLPNNFDILQNFPNPFNPYTNISYSISQISFVNISIYDLLGGKMTTLFNGSQPPGYYKISWDGSLYPSGLYFCKMMVSNNSLKYEKTIKMSLIK